MGTAKPPELPQFLISTASPPFHTSIETIRCVHIKNQSVPGPQYRPSLHRRVRFRSENGHILQTHHVSITKDTIIIRRISRKTDNSLMRWNETERNRPISRRLPLQEAQSLGGPRLPMVALLVTCGDFCCWPAGFDRQASPPSTRKST